MKVLYVSFNNRGIGVDTFEETGFMEDLINHAEVHIESGEHGVVFVYVSEADSGFMKVFSQRPWPAWLKGINMVVRRHFSQDEADSLAISLAEGNSNDVIVFRPYPTGIMTEEDAAELQRKLLPKWGWAYVAPVEKVESDPQ